MTVEHLATRTPVDPDREHKLFRTPSKNVLVRLHEPDHMADRIRLQTLALGTTAFSHRACSRSRST